MTLKKIFYASHTYPPKRWYQLTPTSAIIVSGDFTILLPTPAIFAHQASKIPPYYFSVHFIDYY